MPFKTNKIVGKAKEDYSQYGMGYISDSMKRYAQKVDNLQHNFLNESGYEFTNTNALYKNGDSTMRSFFRENVIPKTHLVNGEPVAYSMEEIEEAEAMMEQIYENDKQGLMESTSGSVQNYNPVIGLGPLVHRFMLMSGLWDSGVIPKYVSKSPMFTIAMETRLLRAPSVNGKKGRAIDIWAQQDQIYDLMKAVAPFKKFTIGLPEQQQTHVLESVFGVNEADYALSNETRIVAVLVEGFAAKGQKYYEIDPSDKNNLIEHTETNPAGEEKKLIWVEVEAATFVSGYQNSTPYDRQLVMQRKIVFNDTATTRKSIVFNIYGTAYENLFNFTCDNADIKKIQLEARLDTANAMMRTCEVEWYIRQFLVEIGPGIPINVPISPQEMKDISALYNINQLSKYMELINIALSNYKDGYCQQYLDDSYKNLPSAQVMNMSYDFCVPEQNHYLVYTEWRRKTFMDQLDLQVSPLLQYLNDPNMTINIIGRNDLIRRLIPVATTYPGKDAIGEIEPDYNKNTFTYGNRIYNFFGYDKMRGNNNLIVLLTPKNSETITYRLYDYQSVVSNDIRNIANPALPALHCFERYRMMSLQPLQGRVRILNPNGRREADLDPQPYDSWLTNPQYSDKMANTNEATLKAYEAKYGHEYVEPLRQRNVNPNL